MFGLIDLRVEKSGQERPNRLEDAAKQRVTALNGRLLEEREGLSVNDDWRLDLPARPAVGSGAKARDYEVEELLHRNRVLSRGHLAHLVTFERTRGRSGEPTGGEIRRDHIHARPVCSRHHRNQAAHEPMQ
jgi:hypothetical protein